MQRSWLGAWLAAVVGLGGAAICFLELAHSGWITDVCDRPEANPRTAVTMALVAVSLVVPLGIALLSRRRALILIAGFTAALSAALWYWLLSPIPCSAS